MPLFLRISPFIIAALAWGCATTEPTEPAPAASQDKAQTPPAQVKKEPPPPLGPVTSEPVILTEGRGTVLLHTIVGPAESGLVTSHAIETSQSIVVVDTQLFRKYAQAFHDHLVASGKPITHVFVSHAHPDHYLGLEVFAAYPTYALPGTIEGMRKRNQAHLAMHQKRAPGQVAEAVIIPKNVLNPGELIVDDVTLVLEQVVQAEDNVQLVVRLPAQQTMIVQDLCANGTHPFFMIGPLVNWIVTLDRYSQLSGIERVLVGHGRPADASVFADNAAYLRNAKELMDAAPSRAEGVQAVFDAYPERAGDAFILEILARFGG